MEILMLIVVFAVLGLLAGWVGDTNYIRIFSFKHLLSNQTRKSYAEACRASDLQFQAFAQQSDSQDRGPNNDVGHNDVE